MKVHDILGIRSAESSHRDYLKEQVREVYGHLRITGTGNSIQSFPIFSFGCIRFMEKPNLVFGFTIRRGTVTKVHLPIYAWRMDSKGFYSGAAFRSIIDASGSFEIEVNYRLQGQCHQIYESGAGWD